MKFARSCLLLLFLTAILGCQTTRTELLRPTTPEDDSKANSPAVPDVYAIDGTFQKIVVLRFKYQSDLLGGLEAMVKQHNIKNAVILAGIGSVRNYHIHSVSNRDFPSKNIFVKNPVEPADIVSVNGYIINGRVHAHMTMTNEHHAFGGHIEPETTVFTFAIVTLGVLNDAADLSRVDDKTHR